MDLKDYAVKRFFNTYSLTTVSQKTAYLIFAVISLICLLAIGITNHFNIIQSANFIGVDLSLLQDKIQISGIVPDGPADRSGIQVLSTIVAIDGHPIQNLRELDTALLKSAPEITIDVEKKGGISSHVVEKGGDYSMSGLFKDTLISALFLILAFISIPCKGCRNTIRNTLLIALFLFLALEKSLLPLRDFLYTSEGVFSYIVIAGILLCAIVGGLTFALELHILCITPRPQAWFLQYKRIILSVLYLLSAYFILTLAVSYLDFEGSEPVLQLFSYTSWSMIDLLWVSLILLILFKQYLSTATKRGRNLLIILFLATLPFVISTILLEWNYLTDSEEQSWLAGLEIVASFIFSIGFMMVIKSYDLADIEGDIKRPLVFKMTSALIIFYLLTSLYGFYLDLPESNPLYILYLGLVILFCGMMWIPLALLLQYLASSPWYSDIKKSQPDMEQLVDSVLSYSSNHRVAENLPRLLNAALRTNWVAVSMVRNANQPYFYLNQQSNEKLDKKQLEAEMISLFFDNFKRSEVKISATSLFESGATHVLPLSYRDEIFGGIALAQNPSYELISTKYLNHYTKKLAEIIFTNKVRELATIDGLTQVLRREAVLEKLYSEFVRFQRTAEEISICLLDLDHFKKVNDSYGHAAGDKVLQQIALIFRQETRSTDYIGRYGGEEFLLIFPNTACEEAKVLLEALRGHIQNTSFNIGQDKAINITVSIGLSCTRQLQLTNNNNSYLLIEKIIEEADNALYMAKQSGRNKVMSGPLPDVVTPNIDNRPGPALQFENPSSGSYKK